MTERIKETEIEEAEGEVEDESTQQIDHCPECSGRVRKDENRGERICEDCGLVVDDRNIDRGPDWRSFSESDRQEKSRVGAPVTNLMHDKGLSTRISWQDKDAYGRSLSSRKRRKLHRLRTWNQRTSTRDSKERNLKQALGEIDRMASALGLPKTVRETTGVLYRRALEEDLLRGRSIEGVSTACLYAAARQCGIPRSFEKFGRVSRVEVLEIKRTYRYIMRELDLEMPPSTPLEYLPQFASDLGLPQEVQNKARELLEDTEKEEVRIGKNPIGIAAAAVYAASLLCNAGYTQDDISEVTDISVVTIRNRYQELLDVYGAEFTTAREAQERFEEASLEQISEELDSDSE